MFNILPTGRKSFNWLKLILLSSLLGFTDIALCSVDGNHRYDFDIKSQQISKSLNAIAKQTGHQLLFSYELVGLIKTQSVKGNYSLIEVLDTLLLDTNLVAKVSKRGVIVITPAPYKYNKEEEKMQNKRSLLAVMIGLFAGSGGISAVSAQDSESTNINTLEEIVVTAERRTSNVQDIPISMTALNGDQLVRKAVTRLDELQFASPGLSIVNSASGQSVNIRGIGLASEDPDVTSGVATYVDGLFQQPIVNKGSFYDVADIQVMRGPQGTFAGAASTGGAIFINSKRASIGEELNGFVEAGLGNYSATNLQGAVTLPINDSLAVRAAFTKRDRDSFFNSVGTVDTNAGDLDEFSGRVGVTWAPTEALEIYAKYQTLKIRNGGLALSPIATTAFSAGRQDDIRDLAYNSPTQNHEDGETYLFDLRYTFENDVTLKLLSGIEEKTFENLADLDGTLLAQLEQGFVGANKQTSHEINLISPQGEQLEWVVGAYDEKTIAGGNQVNRPAFDVILNTKKEIRGVFGQVGYFVTDDVQIEFGLRKAWFDASVYPESGLFVHNTDFRFVVFGGTFSDDDILGKLSVNWTYDENNLFYALIAKGYKPGGINSPISTFDKEQVWSYEAGWKSTMLDGRLRSSISVFYNDYTEFQNNAIDTTTGLSNVTNIAEATIQGVEISVDGQFGNLRIDAGFSYVDSELTPTQNLVNSRLLPGPNLGPQCPANVTSNPPICFDYTNALLDSVSGPNLYAPEISLTLGAEYKFDLPGNLELTPRLNYAWLDEQWTNLFYSEETDLLESRGLLSASVKLEAEKWSVRAYARNITDEEYVVGQASRESWEFYGSPREYGIDFKYLF